MAAARKIRILYNGRCLMKPRSVSCLASVKEMSITFHNNTIVLTVILEFVVGREAQMSNVEDTPREIEGTGAI